MKDGAPVVPRAEPQSYYGRPVLKAPVWTWEVPTYFFFGGMAGAAAPLAYGAHLAGDETLARRATLVSLAGLAVSPPLLISDLGRPERFWRMLRVFKPTSAMSVGTWILSAFGATSGLGLLVPQARAACGGARAAGFDVHRGPDRADLRARLARRAPAAALGVRGVVAGQRRRSHVRAHSGPRRAGARRRRRRAGARGGRAR